MLVLGVVLLLLVASSASASKAPERIALCHQAGEQFVVIEVPLAREHLERLQGHRKHEGDLIPTVVFEGVEYPGQGSEEDLLACLPPEVEPPAGEEPQQPAVEETSEQPATSATTPTESAPTPPPPPPSPERPGPAAPARPEPRPEPHPPASPKVPPQVPPGAPERPPARPAAPEPHEEPGKPADRSERPPAPRPGPQPDERQKRPETPPVRASAPPAPRVSKVSCWAAPERAGRSEPSARSASISEGWAVTTVNAVGRGRSASGC